MLFEAISAEHFEAGVIGAEMRKRSVLMPRTALFDTLFWLAESTGCAHAGYSYYYEA